MKSYGQFCPVAKAAELFCERWTPLILRDLGAGASRFSELHRGVPLMSPTLLSRRLKQLEAEGVIETRPSKRGRRKTYHLTPAGAEFLPVVQSLGVWGQRWSRRELVDHEVDLGLLLWALERSVKPDAFGSESAVVRLQFVDQPKGKDIWWLLNQGDTCELCLEDPGFDVKLYLSCTLPDMIYITRGDLALNAAIASDRLEVIGGANARKRLAAWLNLSPIAAIPSQRTADQACR
ncbi:MAG: helix-turn-helix transcriptional regulator [Rhizobiales bacterium]|nr:helix-turn-helix transcriptional regulator [Hyphomicrobiales bacterium]